MRSPQSSAMTQTIPRQAVTAAYVGCAAAAGYAVLKAAWALGSTFEVNADAATFENFLHSWGGPAVALWGTVLLALLAGAILQSLVQSWGRRIPRRLRASLAWLGFTIMTPIGLSGLAVTLAAVISGDTFPLLTPAIYIYVYTCFSVLGMTFAITAWRTRKPAAAPVSTHQPRTHRSPTALMHPWRTDEQHRP